MTTSNQNDTLIVYLKEPSDWKIVKEYGIYRIRHWKNNLNTQMPSRMSREVCKLNQAEIVLLKTAMKKLQLPARAYDRILKVARTAADLAGKKDILIEHLTEAIQYRSLDRDSWGG